MWNGLNYKNIICLSVEYVEFLSFFVAFVLGHIS